jgi:Domain of unknown function (DUF4926)
MSGRIHELETVALERDLPEYGLRRGDLGAVVHLHTPDILEVEFVRASGETQALVTLAASDVHALGDDDLLTVRPLERQLRRFLPLLALVAGCVGSGERTGASTITDSAGVRIVTSPGSVWGGQGPQVDSIPMVRIGSEETGPYQFSFIMQGLLLDGGRFAVAEAATNEVRLFAADGRHLRSFGRRGRGPGEFQVISGLFRYPGDSLAAYDQIARRTTIFPLSNGEPRVVRTQAGGNLSAFGALGSGQLLLYNPGSGYHPELHAGLQWDTTDVVVLDPADGTAQTIIRLPSRQYFVEADGNTRPLAPAHYAIMAVSDRGFFWATSERYEIRFFDQDGKLRRILRRPVEPEPVVPSMTDAWIAATLEDVRRTEGAAAVARNRQALLAKASFGDQVPLFGRAFVDGDGRLWMGAAIWPELQGSIRRWSIFAADGAWLGDLNAPRHLQILDCRHNLILGIWQQEGEAPHVQVHRLLSP